MWLSFSFGKCLFSYSFYPDAENKSRIDPQISLSGRMYSSVRSDGDSGH